MVLLFPVAAVEEEEEVVVLLFPVAAVEEAADLYLELQTAVVEAPPCPANQRPVPLHASCSLLHPGALPY